MHRSRVPLVCLLVLLWGCEQRSNAISTDQTAATQTASTAAAASAEAASTSTQPAASLDPARGREIGLVVEAFLSPHQESNEEENTPSSVPKQFRSTTPSMTRDQREAAGHRGHGQIRFSKDLSRAWVDVKVEGVDVAKVTMFHIHCGEPGILGPIIVDFALATDIKQNLADGLFTVELKNDHIARTVAQGEGHGAVEGFTRGCIIGSPSLESIKPAKVMTIGGLADLALERQLYFNLHTSGQTYYGDIRGQLYPVGNAQ
ncbi:MAG TPA: CHRD domain-containing protein [Thermoanaerobaculia bacterium]|nr:CHRD domain-containing protein [Thermoanaerobaculia bacterium]